MLRSGKPLLRAGKRPCDHGNCVKGTPEDSKELSAKNWQAYTHYKLCRAVGFFPADETVRNNAAIIRSIEDAYDHYKQLETIKLIGSSNG